MISLEATQLFSFSIWGDSEWPNLSVIVSYAIAFIEGQVMHEKVDIASFV